MIETLVVGNQLRDRGNYPIYFTPVQDQMLHGSADTLMHRWVLPHIYTL